MKFANFQLAIQFITITWKFNRIRDTTNIYIFTAYIHCSSCIFVKTLVNYICCLKTTEEVLGHRVGIEKG